MSVLITDPYLLVEGDLVAATIEALNEIGYSDPSDENQVGAVIQSVPHASLLAPTRGENTSES